MAKLQVRDVDNDSRIPFLRGTLIRSLTKIGIEYEEARHIANQVRDELDEQKCVSTIDVQDAVIKRLIKSKDDKTVNLYRDREPYGQVVMVDYGDGNKAPFSRGIYSQRLQCCGLRRQQLDSITELIQKTLNENYSRSVNADELRELTYWSIDKYCNIAAENYLTWSAFHDSNMPLILLIGGTPGCGKSTLSTEIANRLDVVRTQSTDMLREVMRIMLSEQLVPEIHRSSFELNTALEISRSATNKETRIAEAYHRQVDKVEIACEAVINRALNERISLIVEGVHVRPTWMQRITESTDDAIIASAVLTVFDKKQLRLYIKGRGQSNQARRAKRYLDNFDSIWQLQSMLASEADDLDIEIIDNSNRSKAVAHLIHLIMVATRKQLSDQITALRPKPTKSRTSG